MYDNETALEGFKAQVATLEKQLSQANQGLLTSTQGDESIQQKYTALQRKLQDQETTITLAQLEKKGQRMKIAELEQEVKRVEGLLQESEKASVSSRDAEKRYALLEEKLHQRRPRCRRGMQKKGMHCWRKNSKIGTAPWRRPLRL